MSKAKPRPIPALTEKIVRRFVDKMSLPDSDGCLLWGAALEHGYGAFKIGRKTYRAHRVAYTLWVGEIPDGLVLDHLCRNTACVNPSHLEPVTDYENKLRGLRNQHSAKTHCPKGHPYSEENTYRNPRGHRFCRTCGRAATKAWRDGLSSK